MDSKKLIVVIPIVSALVLAAAIGVMAFSSSSAANGDLPMLTQEDETEHWKGSFGGMRGSGHGGRFEFRPGFDYDAFLADELGVTVEELQDARQAAQEGALEQAVAEGVITAEQADLIQAGKALRQYIDPQEILSNALGIDAADIKAAREAGEPLHELFGDLEPGEIKETLQAAYEEAVQQAIDEGVITESQAEQLQENGFRGGFFGKGGLHGRGGFPFPKPAPTTSGDS